MKPRFLLSFCLITALFQTALLLAEDSPVLDIEKGTLQGKSVFDYTIDQLTDVYGRPSVVKEGERPIIYYHHLGLVFACSSGSSPESKVSRVFIFLSRMWDETNAKHLEPYSGVLNRGIAATWKTDRAVKEFSNLSFSSGHSDTAKKASELARDLRKLAEEAGDPVKTPWPRVDPVLDVVDEAMALDASTEYGTLFLVYEKLTKFIEKVCISGKK